MVNERSIPVTTHGRYLVVPPSAGGAAPLMVGFHGYAEGADAQLARMRAIPGADRWIVVSVQGLHRFYQRRTNEVIASWMTRQDRELAIGDNVAYVSAVIDAVSRDHPVGGRLVFAGFSQGVAMTFRAACAMRRPVDAVIAAGGDVPPELDAAALGRIGQAMVCHGTRDEWYTAGKFGDDLGRLRGAGVQVQPVEFDGGHEWSEDILRAAGALLDTLHDQDSRGHIR